MNSLCWAIVLCVKRSKSWWGTDYTVPRTRAGLIRTYGTVNDGRRLLSSAREATAMFPEVLSAVMDVTNNYVQRDLGGLLLQRLPGTTPIDSHLLFSSHLEDVGAGHLKSQH